MKRELTIREALAFVSQFEYGPKTIQGLVYAGKLCGFLHRKPDGVHWFIRTAELKKYLNSVKNSPYRVSKSLGANPGAFVYTLSKLKIKTKTYHNRTYLEDKDVKRIRKYYQEKSLKKSKTKTT